MATTLYEGQLFDLQEQLTEERQRYPQIVHFKITSDDIIYDVDLNTRKITAPKFISVEYDHNSSVIYFRCARYYQNYDLATSPCIIQYINAAGQGGIYWVPFIETNYTEPEDSSILTEGRETIIIPWVISGLAAIKSGKLTFNIRFFKLQSTSEENNYIYNIETQPAITNILTSLQLKEEDIINFTKSIQTEDAYAQALIDSMNNAITYWTDL